MQKVVTGADSTHGDVLLSPWWTT